MLVAPTPGGPQRADDSSTRRHGRLRRRRARRRSAAHDRSSRPCSSRLSIRHSAIGARRRGSPSAPRAAARGCPARPPRRSPASSDAGARGPRRGAEHTGQRVRQLPRQIGHSPGVERARAPRFAHSSRSTTDCMEAHGRISISLNATRAGDTSRPTLGAMAISSANDNAEPPAGEVVERRHSECASKNHASCWPAILLRRRAVIVDCHCHAGLGDGLTGPWDTEAQLGRYLVRAARAGIDRTVVFAAFHSDYAVANRRVARIVAGSRGRLYGFAFVHPGRDAGRVSALVARGGRAVRLPRHQGAPPRRSRSRARSATRHGVTACRCSTT